MFQRVKTYLRRNYQKFIAYREAEGDNKLWDFFKNGTDIDLVAKEYQVFQSVDAPSLVVDTRKFATRAITEATRKLENLLEILKFLVDTDVKNCNLYLKAEKWYMTQSQITKLAIQAHENTIAKNEFLSSKGVSTHTVPIVVKEIKQELTKLSSAVEFIKKAEQSIFVDRTDEEYVQIPKLEFIIAKEKLAIVHNAYLRKTNELSHRESKMLSASNGKNDNNPVQQKRHESFYLKNTNPLGRNYVLTEEQKLDGSIETYDTLLSFSHSGLRYFMKGVRKNTSFEVDNQTYKSYSNHKKIEFLQENRQFFYDYNPPGRVQSQELTLTQRFFNFFKPKN